MVSQVLNDFRFLSSTAMRTAVGLGAYMVGAATGLTYPRFLGLRAAADRALNLGNLDDADRLARELLDLAPAYDKDFYHGNALHHGNLLRGRAALKRGDIKGAGDFLRAAGRTPGSPQLNSFGPNMLLAKELLEAGEREAVLEYLESCKAFWSIKTAATSVGAVPPAAALDAWADAIREGRVPDFGPNLVY